MEEQIRYRCIGKEPECFELGATFRHYVVEHRIKFHKDEPVHIARGIEKVIIKV